MNPHSVAGFQVFQPLTEQVVDPSLRQDFTNAVFHFGKSRRRSLVIFPVSGDKSFVVVRLNFRVSDPGVGTQSPVDQMKDNIPPRESLERLLLIQTYGPQGGGKGFLAAEYHPDSGQFFRRLIPGHRRRRGFLRFFGEQDLFDEAIAKALPGSGVGRRRGGPAVQELFEAVFSLDVAFGNRPVVNRGDNPVEGFAGGARRAAEGRDEGPGDGKPA